MKKNFHVIPHQKGWAVKAAKSSKVSSVHTTQAQAIALAKQRAMNNKSELLIHGRNGQIRDRDSYGSDPHPPRDMKS